MASRVASAWFLELCAERGPQMSAGAHLLPLESRDGNTPLARSPLSRWNSRVLSLMKLICPHL